jgi:hypothetical protein
MVAILEVVGEVLNGLSDEDILDFGSRKSNYILRFYIANPAGSATNPKNPSCSVILFLRSSRGF